MEGNKNSDARTVSVSTRNATVFAIGRTHPVSQHNRQGQDHAGRREREDRDRDERARQIFFDGEIPDFQVVIPDFGVVEGPFQITALEYSGSHNGEASYELTLASAGQLTFTAL